MTFSKFRLRSLGCIWISTPIVKLKSNELFVISEKAIERINVLSTSGQQLSKVPSFGDGKLDISTLSKGMYIIQIEQKNGNVYHKKLIKE